MECCFQRSGLNLLGFLGGPGEACAVGKGRWVGWLLQERGERRQWLDLYSIHARDHPFKFIRYKSRALGPAHVAHSSKEGTAAAAASLARSCTAALLLLGHLWQGTARRLQWR
jgi:hypothetical protein